MSELLVGSSGSGRGVDSVFFDKLRSLDTGFVYPEGSTVQVSNARESDQSFQTGYVWEMAIRFPYPGDPSKNLNISVGVGNAASNPSCPLFKVSITVQDSKTHVVQVNQTGYFCVAPNTPTKWTSILAISVVNGKLHVLFSATVPDNTYGADSFYQVDLNLSTGSFLTTPSTPNGSANGWTNLLSPVFSISSPGQGGSITTDVNPLSSNKKSGTFTRVDWNRNAVNLRIFHKRDRWNSTTVLDYNLSTKAWSLVEVLPYMHNFVTRVTPQKLTYSLTRDQFTIFSDIDKGVRTTAGQRSNFTNTSLVSNTNPPMLPLGVFIYELDGVVTPVALHRDGIAPFDYLTAVDDLVDATYKTLLFG